MQTIVITGSTSGIGNTLLRVLAKDNIVFAGYRKPECIADLELVSPNVIPFFIDMEDNNSIIEAANFILSRTEKVDLLYNVAGCVVAGAIEDIEVNSVRKQFEINTFSHLTFTQKLLDVLEGGRIINISSMASFGIYPFISPYCASKRALDILFNAINLETHRDIKVISIKPGVIATPLWEKSITLNEKSISSVGTFEKEMKFLVRNAHKNGVVGLNVDKAVQKIIQISLKKHPKPSYTIGLDAYFSSLLSKFPQEVLNFLIKLGMKKRIGN